jgi:hypothetical protein
MSNKKIFSDQQEIAVKLAQLNVKSKEEFIADHEKIYGKVPDNPKFPSVISIYEKFSNYEKKEDVVEQTTPKKTSSKAEMLEAKHSNEKAFEETKSPYEFADSNIKSKMSKQEKLQQKAQMDIETKINEANISAINKEAKRDGSGNNKNKSISPMGKLGKSETMNPHMLAQMHYNPHIQLDARYWEGEDKRAISSGRQNPYAMPAHSPSERQPTTAEKYTLFGFSEDSTICKTPQTVGAFGKPAYVISPYFFNRNAESRFNFARSMDPKQEEAV